MKKIALKLFGKIAEKYSNYFPALKAALLKAEIKMPLQTYISIALFSTFLGFLLSLASILILIQIFEFSLLTKIVLTIFLPLIISISTFGLFLFYPFQKAVSRERGIEVNLPFALTHMGAIAESGAPPYIIFKLMGDYKEYGEVAKEMKKIARNIEEFGMDPLTAIKEVADRCPSSQLKEVLYGIVTTIESGGNIKLYLKNAGEQALFEWRNKREKFLQQLTTVSEFYTGLLITAPLFIIALFAVMNMIQPQLAGFDILFLTQISIYILVPALNIGFLLFLKGIEVEIWKHS